MNTGSTDDVKEARLNEVLLGYVEARQRGERPARDALLREHPDLRAELEEFFAGQDDLERLVAPFRAAQMVEDPPPPSELGQLGDFLLLRQVGRGGMGVVYEAEQISLRRRVALKVLPFAAALDGRQLQRFKNEALAAAHLRHEHIVPVFAVGCERGTHFYAMQFIDGQSLSALIAERREDARPEVAASDAVTRNEGEQGTAALGTHSSLRGLSASSYYRRVAEMGRQAALALEHAHQMGIVHRDIKPGNLLLDGRGQLWVTDFGLAQFSGDVGLTATGEMLGTLRYASPEQVQARRGVVDHRSDVYSLGATLYELVTLRPVFDGRDRHELLRQIGNEDPVAPRRLDADVPVELETVLLKALRKEPGERYATAGELAEDLERFLDNRPVQARRPGLWDHIRAWARRYPAVVMAVVATLLVLTVVSLGSAALVRQEQARTRTEQVRAEAAYQAERKRAEEAEQRLRLAQRSVEELVQISEEELAAVPGLASVRLRMLRSAVAYYQEFIDLREGAPDARAELVSARARVEKLLADLEVLQAASKVYLLHQAAVLDDLGLRGEQRTQARGLAVRAGSQWQESLRAIGRVAPKLRRRMATQRARAHEAEINAVLTREQRDRLRQVALQAEGLSAFQGPEVVAALRLTPQQREQFRTLEEQVNVEWMRTGGLTTALNERVLEVLTDEQAMKWREMIGKPVKDLVGLYGRPILTATPEGRGDKK